MAFQIVTFWKHLWRIVLNKSESLKRGVLSDDLEYLFSRCYEHELFWSVDACKPPQKLQRWKFNHI